MYFNQGTLAQLPLDPDPPQKTLMYFNQETLAQLPLDPKPPRRLS